MRLLLLTARHTWGWTLRLSLLLVVATALLVAVGRLALPLVADYRAELERGLEEYLGLPVRLQGIAAAWSGGGPELRLDGLSLRAPNGGAPLLSATRAVVGVDLPRSLWRGRWVLGKVHLTGPRLVLVQEAGRLRLLGVEGDIGLSLRELPELLAGIHALDMDSGELVLRLADGPPLVLRNLRISLRGGETLKLGLEAGEPEEGRLRGAAELRRRVDDAAWEGRMYLRGQDLEPGAWPLPTVVERLAVGRLGLEVWGEIRDGLLSEAQGRLVLSDLGGATPLGLSAGWFRWRRDATGWTWTSDWPADAGRPLLTRLDLALNGTRLEGHAANLELTKLAAVAAALNPEQRALLDGLSLRGAASELDFRVDLARPTADYALAARVTDLALAALDHRPGVIGLEGRLSLDPSGGRIELDSRDSRLLAPALFRAPLQLSSLAGELAWRRDPAGWVVATPGLKLANADLQAKLKGSVQLTPERGLNLDLKVDFSDLTLARTSAYLPVGGMPPKVVAWLDRALVAGQVTKGRMVLRGRGADFPFREGEGLFETRFQVQDATLDYLPGWPAVQGLNGLVEFRNQGFTALADEARIFDARLSGTRVAIADLQDAELTLTGRATGPGETLLRYVRETPLAAHLGKALGQLRVQGDTTLDLELAIPLEQRSRQIQVQGKLGFTDNTVHLPSWKLSLERLRGEVAFDRQGLTAQGLHLSFRGAPARLDIDTREGLAGLETRYLLSTRQSVATLLGDGFQELELPLTGTTDWNLALVLPEAEREGDFALVLASQLEGLEVGLPPPFHKPAGQLREFTLRVQGRRGADLRLGLDYGLGVQGTAVHAELKLHGFPDQPRFERGELRINAGLARLPREPGLAVRARLSRLELDGLGNGAGPQDWGTWLRTLDVSIDELRVRGFKLNRLRLKGKNQGDALRLEVVGEGVNGRLFLPIQPSPETPVGVDLKRLNLARAPSSSLGSRSPPPDPGDLPPLWVSVGDLAVDDRPLGRLRLAIAPHDGGARLTRLELESELHGLKGSGQWLNTGQGSESRLEATFDSRDPGAFLTALGYPMGLRQGQTEAHLKLHWNGPWSAPRLNSLGGQIELTMGEGRLMNIEPGMGRMMGLFSIPGLLRRLRLDFSDLFREGLAFDGIGGRFVLAKGDAVTEDLTVASPAARILIQGRIGLADRDYDQTVTVIPRVSTALPVAGAIAGGPAVGAALFLAERLLQDNIDQAAQVRYRVTGPWADPIVERQTEPSRRP